MGMATREGKGSRKLQIHSFWAAVDVAASLSWRGFCLILLKFLGLEHRLAGVPSQTAYPEQAGCLFKKAHGVL